MNRLVQHCLALVKPQFALDIQHGIHGIPHWSRVWRNARELAEAEGVDSKVPCLFSFFHDSQRFDDRVDANHGPRASAWLERLYLKRQLPVGMSDFHLLCVAVNGHSYGETEADPIVQVCWDADRLDLGRVGIIPDPERLCTAYAKNPDTIRRALNRSLGQRHDSMYIPEWMRS